MTNTTNVYAGIIKMDENSDGTLTVYGKATDDSLDIDQQICDPGWLDRAMPEWFMTGGNIREQHSNIAAGVAKEYEAKKDGHYISALVVDPVSVKKVKNNVLRGFSIGIKSPRVVRDQKAANGRIIDGQIVEVSLVDRPANPNCQLILAKSVAGADTLVKSEELIEKHGDHDQSDHDPRGGGGGGGGGGGRNDQTVQSHGDEASGLRADLDDLIEDADDPDTDVVLSNEDVELADRAGAEIDEATAIMGNATGETNDGSHYARLEEASDKLDEAAQYLLNADNRGMNAIGRDLIRTVDKIDEYLENMANNVKSAKTTSEESQMSERRRARKSALQKEVATNEMPLSGEAKAIPSREEMLQRYSSARKTLDDITMECKSYGYDDIDKQYGETAEQETAEGPSVSAETAQEEVQETTGDKPLDKELVDQDGAEMEKSTTNKCLECGCNMPGQNHGNPNVSTAVMSSPDQMPVGSPAIQPPTPNNAKSISTIVPPSTIEEVGTIIEEETEDSVETNSADKSLLADVNLNDIVEKAVKSAMSSIEAQVAELKSAKEAVENKATQLESELATAKSLAIGGGPKRTTIATGAKTNNEWKSKADLYFAKASATTDIDLAKGYREMAKDFLAKADNPSEVK